MYALKVRPIRDTGYAALQQRTAMKLTKEQGTEAYPNVVGKGRQAKHTGSIHGDAVWHRVGRLIDSDSSQKLASTVVTACDLRVCTIN